MTSNIKSETTFLINIFWMLHEKVFEMYFANRKMYFRLTEMMD